MKFKNLFNISFLFLAFCSSSSMALTPNEIKAIINGANDGDAASQYNLGVMYMNDLGTSVNKSLAKSWLTHSCNGKIQDACELVKILH